MPASESASAPSADFAWLSPTCRPSREEVEIYAHLINAVEHNPPERLENSLHEAELQLWIWRNEVRQHAPRRRRNQRPALVSAET